MRGFCGNGKPDYVAFYKEFYVIVTKAKKAEIEEALPQVIAEIATARYATGENRSCHKRSFDELDLELPVSAGIRKRHGGGEPENGGGVMGGMVKGGRFQCGEGDRGLEW